MATTSSSYILMSTAGSTPAPVEPSTSSPSPSRPVLRDPQPIPMIRDNLTFTGRQEQGVKDLERRMAEELKKKEKEWQKSVDRMREEFLYLHPCDYSRGRSPGRSEVISGSTSADNMIENGTNGTEMETNKNLVNSSRLSEDQLSNRRGSAEILDIKKLKTLYFDYPPEPGDGAGTRSRPRKIDTNLQKPGNSDTIRSSKSETRSENGVGGEWGRRFQLRFNVQGFDPASISVTTDGSAIVVRASRLEDFDMTDPSAPDNEKGSTKMARRYFRKIQKPKEIMVDKLRSYLTADMILVVEAPLNTPRKSSRSGSAGGGGNMSHSVSRSSHGSNASRASSKDSQGGGSNSPGTPGGGAPKEKVGVPIFRDENGTRKMYLTVDLGSAFEADDVIVQVLKENRIQIRAKHRVKTPERLSKNKFNKEFELGEKIETYSLRGGLTADGKLLVNAFAKGHGDLNGEEKSPAKTAS